MKSMYQILLCILLAIALLYLCYINNKNENNKTIETIIETYDDKETDIELNKCAEFCKTITGCTGFGYDTIDKVCYPSQKILTGRPVEGTQKAKYKENHIRCNKITTIKKVKGDRYEHTSTLLKNNATYTCADKEDKHSGIHVHDDNGNLRLVNGLDEIQKISIKPYEVNLYKWPLNELQDKEILDVVKKEKINEDIETPSFFPEKDKHENSDISEKYSPRFENIDMFKLNKSKTKEIKKKPKLENINMFNIVSPEKEEIIREIETDCQGNKPCYNVYKSTDKYNNGKFMKKHKCVNNINKKDCLAYCTKEDKCVGVEWNPYFIEYKNDKVHKFHRNVCCPMETNEFKKRDLIHDLGSYYIKKRTNNLSISTDYVE